MANGKVVAIYVSPVAGEPMQKVESVEAIAGAGLKGDRYCTGEGSYNRDAQGKRQVTLINAVFFEGSGFDYADSRRNIVTEGIELMWLIGREFCIGDVRMRGVKYCDPCNRPSKLSGKGQRFEVLFSDRGGLIAEILSDGVITNNSEVIPPPKGY